MRHVIAPARIAACVLALIGVYGCVYGCVYGFVLGAGRFLPAFASVYARYLRRPAKTRRLPYHPARMQRFGPASVFF